jgi:hypothetical protein
MLKDDSWGVDPAVTVTPTCKLRSATHAVAFHSPKDAYRRLMLLSFEVGSLNKVLRYKLYVVGIKQALVNTQPVERHPVLGDGDDLTILITLNGDTALVKTARDSFVNVRRLIKDAPGETSSPAWVHREDALHYPVVLGPWCETTLTFFLTVTLFFFTVTLAGVVVVTVCVVPGVITVVDAPVVTNTVVVLPGMVTVVVPVGVDVVNGLVGVVGVVVDVPGFGILHLLLKIA